MIKFLKHLFRKRWNYSADGKTRTHVETGKVQYLFRDDWGSGWLDHPGDCWY